MVANAILEGIGDAIYSVAPDWSLVFFNRQAEVFFARPRAEVIGRSLWESFPAVQDSPLGAQLRQVMQTRAPVAMVTLSPTTGRWADARIFPLVDGSIAVSWRDITAQKTQEAALAEATQAQELLVRRLGAIADHVPAMIAQWDRDLKCRFANAAYMEWFGRTSSEMLDVSIQELMGEALFAKNEPYIRAVLAGHPQSFERTLTKPSGEIGHTWAQYIPDVDAEGRVVGLYALVTDVTPLKRAEEQLVKANAELEAARDEAEAATAVKSAFLSNMSHELRNPLTSIIGYLQLLSRRAGMGETELKYLGRMGEASDALLTTVNDLLDFSKLEAGQVEIERRSIDPIAVGLRALEMFEPEMDKKGLEHRFEVIDAPAHVLADDTRIRQILLNLIGNAVKFTVSASVGVRCIYEHASQTLRYEVVDTGPGIPAEQQAKLFRRFSQVDASTTRTFGGTGLGLAICKGLAEAMGGAVGVLSFAAEGSCFWLTIPAPCLEQGAGAPGSGSEILADPEALRGTRLLVVDDEPANRDLVRQIVEPLGVQVTEADSGSEAVNAARSKPFDLILMDIRMPGIDGPSAASMIRSKPELNASTPMIAFTAEVVGVMPAAWTPMFNGLLTKPLAPAELVAWLATCRRGDQPPALEAGGGAG